MPSYWVVDPDLLRLRAWEFDGARYRPVGDVSGEAAFKARRPFPVDVVPARLVTG